MKFVSALVAGLRDGLMVTARGHPLQDVFRVPDGWCEDERPEEPDEFRTDQRNELDRSGRGDCDHHVRMRHVDRINEPERP